MARVQQEGTRSETFTRETLRHISSFHLNGHHGKQVQRSCSQGKETITVVQSEAAAQL